MCLESVFWSFIETNTGQKADRVGHGGRQERDSWRSQSKECLRVSYKRHFGMRAENPYIRSAQPTTTQPEPEPVVPLLDFGGNVNASLLGSQPSAPVNTVQPNLGPVAGTDLSKSGGLSAQDLSFFEGL